MGVGVRCMPRRMFPAYAARVCHLRICVLVLPLFALPPPLSTVSYGFDAAGIAFYLWAPTPSSPRTCFVVFHPSHHSHVQPARSWSPFGLGSLSSAISVAAASSTSSAPRTLSSMKRADSNGWGASGRVPPALLPCYICCCNARWPWLLGSVGVRLRVGCPLFIGGSDGLP